MCIFRSEISGWDWSSPMLQPKNSRWASLNTFALFFGPVFAGLLKWLSCISPHTFDLSSLPEAVLSQPFPVNCHSSYLRYHLYRDLWTPQIYHLKHPVLTAFWALHCKSFVNSPCSGSWVSGLWAPWELGLDLPLPGQSRRQQWMCCAP